MPSIGGISLDIGTPCASGVGFLLVTPPKKDISYAHDGCLLLASKGMAYAICCFEGAASAGNALALGRERLQRVLDMASVLGIGDLATKSVDAEYLVWWKEDGKAFFELTTTATSSMSVGHVELQVVDAQGSPVPRLQALPRHHVAFRFYRSAQVSDDLYDAFRNTYLAFENLLSWRIPRGSEREINWLHRALRECCSELNLSQLAACSGDAVEHVIRTVYTDARLPLFHAKEDHAYYAPASDARNRNVVEAALSLLTSVVLEMANRWFDARRRGGWINLNYFAERYESMLQRPRFICSNDPSTNDTTEPSAEVLDDGASFSGTYSREPTNRPMCSVYGVVSLAHFGERTSLRVVYLTNDGKPLIGHFPEAKIDLTGFDSLAVRFILLDHDASRPRYFFPR